MHELFAAFGIDWRLMLINLFNFGLLLGILWYFLYQPLTHMLESRRQKVAQGVQDAEAAAFQLKKIEESRAGLLAQAGLDADEVLAHARTLGTQNQQEFLSQAQASAAALLHEADLQAKEMKRAAIEESKHEVAKLVVLGMERTMLQNK